VLTFIPLLIIAPYAATNLMVNLSVIFVVVCKLIRQTNLLGNCDGCKLSCFLVLNYCASGCVHWVIFF